MKSLQIILITVQQRHSFLAATQVKQTLGLAYGQIEQMPSALVNR